MHCVRIHSRIPASQLRAATCNIDSTLKCVMNKLSNCIEAVSGCSCTDVYQLGLQCLFVYWHDTFELDLPVLVARAAAEIMRSRQEFLRRQHPGLKLLVKDIADFNKHTVTDVDDTEPVPMPMGDVFFGGFVCKDLTNANSNRKNTRSNVRLGLGESGQTYSYCRRYTLLA